MTFVSRGTGSIVDGIQDGEMSLGGIVPEYMQLSRKFYNDVKDNSSFVTSEALKNINTTGHSLGATGADSIAIAAMGDGATVGANIKFEGYGVKQLVQGPNAAINQVFEDLVNDVGSVADVRAHLEKLADLQNNFTSTDLANLPAEAIAGIEAFAKDSLNTLNDKVSSYASIGTAVSNTFEQITNITAVVSDIQSLFDDDVANIKADYFQNADHLSAVSKVYVRDGDLIAGNPLSTHFGETINLVSAGGSIGELHSMHNYSFDSYDINGELVQDGSSGVGHLNKDAVDAYFKPLLEKAEELGTKLGAIDTEIQNFNPEQATSLQKLELQKRIAELTKEEMTLKEDFKEHSSELRGVFGLYDNFDTLNDEVTEIFNDYLDDGELDINLGEDTGAEDALVDIALDIAEKTRQAEQTRVFSFDPLTFDLDSDGIETVSFEQGVLFDHQSTGVKEGTGWVSADDGLLVRDLDGNGTIDSGRELFGDNTLKADGTKAAHGFEALAELDSNADGIFDVNDAEFENLQVWQDTNQDGISQASELKGLSQVGVSSIDLSHQSINRATDGGVISDISTFTKTDGTTAEIGNLFLDREPATTEFTNDIEIPDKVLSSGFDIKGIGSVRNLAQATSLSSSLANTFNQITQDPLNSFSYTDDLVKDWAASSNFSDTLKLESLELEDGTSFKFNISASTRENLEKIQTIESLTGNSLIQTNIEGDQLTLTYGSVTRSYSISRGQENVLSDSYFTNGWSRISNTMALDMNKLSSIYTDIVTSVRDSIYQQVVFPELVSHLDFEHNENGEVLDANFDQINSLLKQQIEVDALEGVSLLFKAKESLGSSFMSSELEYSDFLSGLSANDVANINNRKIIIDGQHLILGSKGDDTVGKYYDNSLVIAGKGDDRITANGTVVYNLGDGFDTIQTDKDSKLVFGEGITQDSLKFQYANGGKDLLIQIGDDPSQGVQLKDFYYLKRAPTIEFSDGNVLSSDSEIFNLPVIGTDGDDNIVLSNVYDSYVEAGKGNDHIGYGQTNDYTNDTFKYNLGDGFDTIGVGYNNSKVQNGDRILFGEGISPEDLSFKRVFNDLIVNIKGDESQGLKIYSFFPDSENQQIQLDKFEFADYKRFGGI